jgi:hypothetical protein
MNLTQADFNQLTREQGRQEDDIHLTQADLDQLMREQNRQEDVAHVPVPLVTEEEEEEREAPDNTQWAVREGQTRMPIAQAIAGGRL